MGVEHAVPSSNMLDDLAFGVVGVCCGVVCWWGGDGVRLIWGWCGGGVKVVPGGVGVVWGLNTSHIFA